MMAKKGLLAREAMGEEPGEAAENETPQYEAREEFDPSLEQGEPGEANEANDGGSDAGDMQAQQLDPKMVELVNLVVSRAVDALAHVASELDSALKADPVQGAVQFGVQALRQVAQAAEKAGKPLAFEVIFSAGLMVIKELAAIANEKGYLPDEQIETFLKEVMQQSLSAYAKLDQQDGLIDDKGMAVLAGAAGQPADGAAPRGVMKGA